MHVSARKELLLHYSRISGATLYRNIIQYSKHMLIPKVVHIFRNSMVIRRSSLHLVVHSGTAPGRRQDIICGSWVVGREATTAVP